jgi:predicted GIY-YIG superfamily endonuclease
MGRNRNLKEKMLVYKITNNVNGHGYIGITQCALAKRWREHLCAARTGSDKRLYRAMRKYGTDNFSIVVIHEATSFEELQRLECELVIEHNTHAKNGQGYNLTAGGEGRDRADQKFGEALPYSLLTEEIVAFARDPQHWNISNADVLALIADKFDLDCSIDTVKDARNGSSWTHLNIKYPPVKRGKGVRHDVMSAKTLKEKRDNLAKYRAAAIAKSAAVRKDKRGANAKLSEQAVRDIFFHPESLNKTAIKFGVSKKMVLLIKQRRAHTYLTQGL